MLTKLKKQVQALLVNEATIARKIGLTPNMVSIIGMVFAFLSTLAYLSWKINKLYILVAVVLLIISGFCDVFDGVLARLYREATIFGGFFDSMLDRYADALVLAGLILGELCDVSWGLAALIGSLLVSYSRSRAEACGIKMESVGLMERSERIIILIVTSTLAFIWQPETVMSIGVVLLALLTNITVLQRGLYVINKLKRYE